MTLSIDKKKLLDCARGADYMQRMKMKWWKKENTSRDKAFFIPEALLDKIFMMTYDELHQAQKEVAEKALASVPLDTEVHEDREKCCVGCCDYGKHDAERAFNSARTILKETLKPYLEV